MRRFALVVPLLLAVVAGCSSSLTVSKGELERQVGAGLNSTGVATKSVSCPGDLVDPKPGNTVRCTLTDADGVARGVTVSVKNVQGSNVNFDFRADDVVKQAVLEKQAADSLEQSVGQRPDKVVCPGDMVNPQPGSTMRCTIKQNDGTSIGLVITLTTVNGSDIKFDVKVDQTPTPAPTS